MLGELRYYSRMAAGVARMQRLQMPADPENFLRDGLRNRETRFLDLLRRTVFAIPEHPYAQMFRAAGCEPGDLAKSVRGDGLDAALHTLRSQGVFLSHDEWKGKKPVVRSGRAIPTGPRSFKNPLVTGGIETSSSGSTGTPTATVQSMAGLVHQGVYRIIRTREFAVGGRAWIDVKSILPSSSGLKNALSAHRTGIPVDRWFTPGSSLSRNGHYRAVTRALVTIGNLSGAGAPYPVYLPANNFSPVAEHIALRRSQGRECVVHGFASPLVRVAAAAIEKGLDIRGTIFFCGGEPLTPAKAELFESAGARAFPGYTISEIGNVGVACSHNTGNTVHLLEDSVAGIGYPRDSAGGPVNSLHFTTLNSYAPNIFINVEMDDDGELVPATCDCLYARLGFTRRVERLGSFGKANPQGMTFHGTDLIDILERVLPARIGGGPGDYQLVECEAATGQTQLRIYVSARAGVTDPSRVREAFLQAIRPRFGGALASVVWTHSAAIEVVIAEPLATRSGKIHPFRSLGAA